jgi:hypothetical protein
MKFSIRLVLLLFGVWASSLPALAQQSAESKLITLSGTVLSADSLMPVSGVHVLNNKSRIGATTDDKGYFTIAMHRTDTILFSAVGYEIYHLVLDPDSRANSPLVEIKLEPKTYELKEVDVRAIPTEDQFKKDFLAIKLPDEPSYNSHRSNSLNLQKV